MSKEKYYIRIGHKDSQDWGGYIEATSRKDLKEKVLDQIENLWPLNSTPEGAEAYRNRFRGKPLFACKLGEKEFTELL
jgi:hypothetical protein